MCGLVGIFASNDQGQANFREMVEALRHRGPDSFGLFDDSEKGVSFGHRRLAVLDLAETGHQPMADPTGRYVIVFNGEIYNHQDLRAQLDDPPPWRGTSDTETLLAAIARWGVEATLQRIRGMFAFALWDRNTATLTLSRDRLGEKPLYFGWAGGAFLFASELAAFEALVGFEGSVNPQALSLLLRFGYVPAPWSIYQHCFKLEPGALLTITREATGAVPEGVPAIGHTSPGLAIRAWWSLQDTVRAGRSGRFSDEAEALDTLHDTLSEATRRQLLSDVPLGAFLSGGIDSSLVVALMQANCTQPVRTFTVGFDNADYDEAPQAARIAAHLGTDHTEFTVTEVDALELVPALAHIYSEPFADASQLPTTLISRNARRHVTVALTGDGGDEFFGGYNRYTWAGPAWRWLSRLPGPLRASAAGGLAAAGRNPMLRGLLESLGGFAQGREKLAKLANRARHADSAETFYAALTAVNADAQALLGDEAKLARAVAKQGRPADLMRSLAARQPDLSFEERMMVVDALTYLPDDILCKVDRAAMSTSLETRVPYLDSEVVACAWRLQMDMKLRNGDTKWALRRILERYVPRNLFGQPKRGFAVPLDDWLRGPLRDWAEALLDEHTLSQKVHLRPTVVRELWHSHLAGRGEHGHALWAILMFQAWLERRPGVT